MKTTILSLALLIGAISCTHEEPPTLRPLEQLLQSSRSELCAGVLAEALREIRAPGYSWNQRELERTLRWSYGHHHDDCGADVNGRAVWMQAIEAWGQMSGDDAGQALVASLRVSHNLAQDPRRQRLGFDRETDAALEALESSGPHSARVVGALLRWYTNEGDCSSLAEYRDRVLALVVAAGEPGALTLTESFPPQADAPRCDPGWMMSEVIEAAPAGLQQQLVSQLARPAIFADDLRHMMTVTDASRGPLEAALADQACNLALQIAQLALRDPHDDPRNAVADTYTTCAPIEGGARRIEGLQQRLSRWLIAHDQAEEALSIIESLPAEEVDSMWLTEVGVAVIRARLMRSAPLEALAMYEQLGERIGMNHMDLQSAREALRPALIENASSLLQERNFADARAHLEPAERLFGETEESTRLRVLLALVETIAASEAEGCPEDDEVARLHEGLTQARDLVRDQFREDEAIPEMLTQANRQWRRLTRRCRIRRRR